MSLSGDVRLRVEAVAKRFVLHLQGETVIDVFSGIGFEVRAGECVAVTGASGTGKSTLLRMVYGNYLCAEGRILIRHRGATVDLASAEPHEIVEIRRETLGWVSQFLRVVPRVPTLELVSEPLRRLGTAPEEAEERAGELLTRLRIGPHLWSLPPATFSGGEQQRVNIARGLIHPYPVMLLDEPTASLDRENGAMVLDLIEEAKARGAALLGIFHDEEVRRRVADREVNVTAHDQAA